MHYFYIGINENLRTDINFYSYIFSQNILLFIGERKQKNKKILNRHVKKLIALQHCNAKLLEILFQELTKRIWRKEFKKIKLLNAFIGDIKLYL